MNISILLGLNKKKEEIKRIKAAFNEIDTDKNGVLSKDEILKNDFNFFGIASNWEELINKIDLDNNGQIDFYEFMAATIDHVNILTDENIRYAFDILDTDKKGFLEIEQLKKALPSGHNTTYTKIIKESLPVR